MALKFAGIDAVTATGATIPVRTQAIVPVDTWAVITRMTSGARRLIGRRCPGYACTVVAMTGCAGEIAAVISGIIGRGVMKYQRQPIGAGVTVVALQGCHEMGGGFSGGLYTIMATGAGAGDTAVIKVGRCPRHGTVACVAGGTGGYVISRFAHGCAAVMTTGAGTRSNTVVIKNRSRPCGGGMTIIADVVCQDMIGGLAGRNSIVMAAETGADDRQMIDPGYRTPGAHGMAIITDVGCQ